MPDLITRLQQIDTCAASDALDKLGLPGVVTGLLRLATDHRIAGRVLTVKLESADVARAVAAGPPRHLCTTAIEAAQPGDIICVEQRTGLDAASWGGNLSIGAQLRQVAGVIVEGPVRDVDESRALGFPVFARSATARTARGRIAETATNHPITFKGSHGGDVTVNPGDYAIADASGVVFIPAAQIEPVLATAEAIVAKESAMAAALRTGTNISQVMGANYEHMLK